jgi:hypothetical protein
VNSMWFHWTARLEPFNSKAIYRYAVYRLTDWFGVAYKINNDILIKFPIFLSKTINYKIPFISQQFRWITTIHSTILSPLQFHLSFRLQWATSIAEDELFFKSCVRNIAFPTLPLSLTSMPWNQRILKKVFLIFHFD